MVLAPGCCRRFLNSHSVSCRTALKLEGCLNPRGHMGPAKHAPCPLPPLSTEYHQKSKCVSWPPGAPSSFIHATFMAKMPKLSRCASTCSVLPQRIYKNLLVAPAWIIDPHVCDLLQHQWSTHSRSVGRIWAFHPLDWCFGLPDSP